jgi:hypothetical protein
VLGAQVVAMLPEACEQRSWRLSRRVQTLMASCKVSLASTRGGGRPASDARLDAIGAVVFACLRAFRRALRARGDRLPARRLKVGASGGNRLWRNASMALRIKERRVVWRDLG